MSSPRPTWHRVYYALGAINVISVVLAIALNYRATAGFADSIAINQAWASRIARYNELAQAARHADAPGNDVFEDGDVERQAAQLARLRATFERQHAAAVTDLAASISPALYAPLVLRLREADVAFAAMMTHAERIFAAFRAGDRVTAGRHMAAMDRAFFVTGEALGTLRGALRELQRVELDHQRAESTALRHASYALLALVVIIVSAVLAYGRKLTRLCARQQAVIEDRDRERRRVLERVDQGVYTIRLDGAMSADRSAIADRWFGAPAAGATLVDHLAPHNAVFARSLALGLGELRDPVMPRELVLDQLPRRFAATDRIFDVAYTPIAAHGRDPEQLLVVISDVTAQVAREIDDREQRDMVGIFQRISIDRGGVEEFLIEASALVARLRDARDPDAQKRLVHELKSNCAIYGLDSYAALTEEIESEVADDGLTDAQREALVAMWRQAMRRVGGLLGAARRETIEVERGELAQAARLSTSVELSAMLESWTCEPVARRLERLAMHIGEVARRLGKPEPVVELRDHGLRLDSDGWTAFWAAMIHVVRHTVEHGLEDEATRLVAGKPRVGRIALEIVRDAQQLVLTVTDDGRGTEGVGLAALADVVAELGGTVDVRAERGRGTTRAFRFPQPGRPVIRNRASALLGAQFDS